MNGLYFRQNNWKKVEGLPISISYAYVPLTYNKEAANPDFFDRYYPINVVLTKDAISFYSSNVLEAVLDNKAPLSYYQSQAFLSFSLENVSALEAEIKRVDGMHSNESIENIFSFSKDLNDKEINKRKENKIEVGADFLTDLLPDLNRITEKVDESKDEKKEREKKVKEDQNNYYKIIFLNFLSDFFYSNTFKRHPNYKRTRSVLEKNKTIQAILAKGYYQYTLAKNKALVDEKKFVQKRTIAKWKSNLKTATKNWHELIINKEYSNTIKAGTTWFDDQETEHKKLMDDLYAPKILTLSEGAAAILSTDQVTDSVSWLSSRYDLLGAFYTQFRYFWKRERWSLILAFAVLLSLVIFFIEIETVLFSKGLMELFNSCKYRMGIIVILIVVLITLLTKRKELKVLGKQYAVSNICISIWKIEITLILCSLLILCSPLILVAFYFCYLTTILIFLSLLAGGMVLSFGVIIIIQRVIIGLYYCMIKACYCIINVVNSTFYFSNKVQVFDSKGRKVVQKSINKPILSIPKFLRLLKLRILFASAAVWAVIYANSGLWNIDLLIEGEKIIFLILIILIFGGFISAKLKDFTKLKPFRLHWRVVYLLLLGFIYSIGLGISATTVAMENTFVKEGYYEDFFKTLDKDTTKSTLEKRLTDKDYTTAKNILYPKVIGKDKQDTIIAYTKPKTNVDKKLLKILPLLKKSISENEEQKLVYHIKVNMPKLSFTNPSKPFSFEFYIVPDFLIFYSIIATMIGMFIELFFKQKE